MSAATADRLLRFQRLHCLRSLSTAKAGPLLKQQIPIRTFEDWNEAKPGFLEVDLVAHCGSSTLGSFLYTLTDVATGWTECLPVLNRGREEVLAGLQRTRTLFPFPVLGIDTDNGGEFLNEDVVAYCAREQITFTRGRPSVGPSSLSPRCRAWSEEDGCSRSSTLWVLFDTGISVSKVCTLCVSDLDRKTGTLRVRGKGGKERQTVLGAPCLGYLLSALDQACATRGTRAMRKSTGTDPLFCSEHGCPLTKKSLALLFRRLRTRAGMDEIPISPKVFRHSFALRYLQAGGNLQGLQELLGYEGMAPVRQYQRWYDQVLHDQMQKGTEEG